MKRALVAVGDTGAAPSSFTKASFEKGKTMRERLEGFFFFFFLLQYNPKEGLLGSRRIGGAG